MSKIKVSVITPSYNSGAYIDKTILSVTKQTISDWELLVVDDCSLDNSVEVINDWIAKDKRIKLFTLSKNSGSAEARNKAIRMAQGRYIAFLDSDDSWMPDKLEKQICFMERNNIALSYTAYEKVDKTGKILGKMGVPKQVSYTSLLKKCEIGCLTAMYDTQILGKIYMPNIRKRQDLGLWLKILREVPFAYGIQEVLACYTVRSDSISANKKSAALYTWRLYRDVEKLPLMKALYYFGFYAINGILRTKFPNIARQFGVLK